MTKTEIKIPTTVTYEPITTEGEYYTSANTDFAPSYSIAEGIDNTGTFTISTDGWSNYNESGTYIDTDLVKSNPTCKALWDQFMYVYTMVEADKENNEDKDDIPF